MMQVRTFAEEVNAQFTRPDPGTDAQQREGLARAVVVATPPALLAALAVFLLLSRWAQRLPPLAGDLRAKPLIRLGSLRWPLFAANAAALVLVLGVPLASLSWKAGYVPPGSDWSGAVARRNLGGAWVSQHQRIASSLAWSAVAGILAAGFALLSIWAVRRSRPGRAALLLMLVVLWTLPAPVLGIGLKETIGLLLNLEEWLTAGRSTFLRTLLYNGPSAAPVVWCTALRFLPAAAALLWPVVRLAPRELEDAATADHADAWRLARHVLLPFSSAALVRAAVVVTALSLGELSASKLVETPGGQTFAHEVFMQMHFGVSNHLAAMCLLLLAAVAAGGLAAPLAARWARRAAGIIP